jgi:predicted metal-dependent hydrolase
MIKKKETKGKARINYSGGQIPIQVIRSDRRSLTVQVKADQTVVARIPRWTTDREIKNFLSTHANWIIRKYEEAGRKQDMRSESGIPVWEHLGRAERRQIKDRFTEKVSHYAGLMGVSVNRIFIKNQKTRWGSCSSKGNVNFNYRLYYMPEELLDYVVIHELAHRKHMNHSPAFWAEVAVWCPDYKAYRKRLREYAG